MLGSKKINIDLVNKLFAAPNKINFIQIEEPSINELVEKLRSFKVILKREYEHDMHLHQEAENFIKILQRIVGTLRNYSTYVKANQKELFDFVKIVKTPGYEELYEYYVGPIMVLLKEFLSEYRNAYIEKMGEIITESENLYIITKHKMLESTLTINGREISVIRDKEFLEMGVYAKQLLFIGTPSYFPQNFSEIFYAEKISFIGYSCFESNIQHDVHFSKIIKTDVIINTIFKNVEIEKGYKGINYRTEIGKSSEKISEEHFLKVIEKRKQINSEGTEVLAKAAYISNKRFMFIPLNQKVNSLDRETFKVNSINIKDIKDGELLIFRSQNGAGLIKEVADELIGKKAYVMRKNLSIWKNKLIRQIERQGLSTISRILINKYKIKSATENNIKNWINPYSIKPKSLEKILVALNFDEKSRKIIQSHSEQLMGAHISAGFLISKGLMDEINSGIENIIEEKGYYKFNSTVFKGASFNIEEIQKLSSETFNVKESDVFKIFST